MKEQEFDIYARNLLKDAEENVSPAVWEGVSAALDGRKTIPFVRWASAAAALAAAVTAAVVMLRPSTASLEHHSQPVSLYTAAASGDTPREPVSAAGRQDGLLPLAEQLAGSPVRTAQAVPVLPEPLPAEVTPLSEAAPAETREEVPAVAPDLPRATLEDRQAMDRLARQAEQEEDRGFSLSASGNVQTKQRGWSRSGTVPIRYGAEPAIDLNKEQVVFQNSETFFLPLSAGVNAMYNFSYRWSASAGLRYTYLGRSFKGEYISGEGWNSVLGPDTVIDNHQHWFGIPVNAYFTFLNSGRLRAHVFAGGAVEFLLKNDNLVHDPMGNGTDVHFVENDAVPQWSVDAGLGFEFRLTPLVSLYLDPQLRYYFATNPVQPRSLRTIQPLRFDVEAGLRFNLGK